MGRKNTWRKAAEAVERPKVKVLARELEEEYRFAVCALDSGSLAEVNRAEAAKAMRVLTTSGAW
jgi:hypothetical protein